MLLRNSNRNDKSITLQLTDWNHSKGCSAAGVVCLFISYIKTKKNKIVLGALLLRSEKKLVQCLYALGI